MSARRPALAGHRADAEYRDGHGSILPVLPADIPHNPSILGLLHSFVSMDAADLLDQCDACREQAEIVDALSPYRRRLLALALAHRGLAVRDAA
jgi:hypothetical protein